MLLSSKAHSFHLSAALRGETLTIFVYRFYNWLRLPFGQFTNKPRYPCISENNFVEENVGGGRSEQPLPEREGVAVRINNF